MLLALVGGERAVLGDFVGGGGSSHRNAGGLVRGGRQLDGSAVPGGVDFSGCVTDPATGLCCVDKLETVTSLQKDPILECTHKNVEQCHYTYVTQFTPSQEEVCEVCSGQWPEECRTVYESSCITKYVEKQPGKLSVTPAVQSFLLRSVVPGAPLRGAPRSAMTRPSRHLG